MVDFGSWELPQQYSSIRDEHLAVRNVAGVFDLSHMGRLDVRGRGAADFLPRRRFVDLLTTDRILRHVRITPRLVFEAKRPPSPLSAAITSPSAR